jgi:hypothetical protein
MAATTIRRLDRDREPAAASLVSVFRDSGMRYGPIFLRDADETLETLPIPQQWEGRPYIGGGGALSRRNPTLNQQPCLAIFA